MDKNSAFMSSLSWIGGIALTVLIYIFAEGWLILVVKIFGFTIGTAIVTLVTLALSWLVIYYSSGARNIGKFRDWIKEKEGHLSTVAKGAMNGGKALAVVNTTVFLGPIVASILMLMLGLDRKRVYIYSVMCALGTAIIWCGLYSGVFWGIHKFIMGGK
ncbi:MAG: hypothetical protein WC779_06655 [Candidatus Omnitrophota bacterium]|jgi:hypothetical protein